MEAVRGHLLLTNCLEDELTRPNIELAMKADRLLWLDLEGTDDEVLTLLHEVFKIHPLAVEDVVHHPDYLATVLHLFGMDASKLIFKRNGRNETILDGQAGQVVKQILA